MDKKSVRKNTKTARKSPTQLIMEFNSKLDERLRSVEDFCYNMIGNKLNEYVKYIVYHEPKKIYTTIGAKNIHHAFNKATKLFKGDYTGLYLAPNNMTFSLMRFVDVATFNKLIQE